LLGTGEANPVGFALPFSAGVLVVATDGFFNYARRADVVATVVQSDFVTLPRKLLSLVRLKSGELWDDVAIVVCRKRPPQRTRKRFVLDEVGGE
jgi:PPM family protein phosphatase